MIMTAKTPSREVLSGAFGFDPAQAASHFLIHIPTGATLPVDISEHLSWDAERVADSVHLAGERDDGQIRCRLARAKWNDIAEVVRAEFNIRLRKLGHKPGKWKPGYNPISRLFGKELTLLAWAIEDADPALIQTAVANWQGLAPEERWWLYTMTAAATGNAVTGRNRGWRKAVRFALTENPISAHMSDQPQVPEFFRLVCEASADDAPVELPERQEVSYTPAPSTRRPRRKASA